MRPQTLRTVCPLHIDDKSAPIYINNALAEKEWQFAAAEFSVNAAYMDLLGAMMGYIIQGAAISTAVAKHPVQCALCTYHLARMALDLDENRNASQQRHVRGVVS